MAIIVIQGETCIFDDEDEAVVKKYKWWLSNGYALTKIKWTDGRRRTIGMHRIILGDPPTPSIDHLNRNKLDNRKENLIACSDAANNKNKPIEKGKLSKYRGVSRHRNKWQVVLRIEGKPKWIGIYKTEEEANEVAKHHFEGIAP
jgi:hypothetical protein